MTQRSKNSGIHLDQVLIHFAYIGVALPRMLKLRGEQLQCRQNGSNLISHAPNYVIIIASIVTSIKLITPVSEWAIHTYAWCDYYGLNTSAHQTLIGPEKGFQIALFIPWHSAQFWHCYHHSVADTRLANIVDTQCDQVYFEGESSVYKPPAG